MSTQKRRTQGAEHVKKGRKEDEREGENDDDPEKAIALVKTSQDSRTWSVEPAALHHYVWAATAVNKNISRSVLAVAG